MRDENHRLRKLVKMLGNFEPHLFKEFEFCYVAALKMILRQLVVGRNTQGFFLNTF